MDELSQPGDPGTQAWADAARMVDVFDQLPAGIAYLHGPDLVFRYVNRAYAALLPGRDVVGRRVDEAVPEVVEQGLLDVLHGVLATGEAYVAEEAAVVLDDASGAPVTRYFTFVYAPVAPGAPSGAPPASPPGPRPAADDHVGPRGGAPAAASAGAPAGASVGVVPAAAPVAAPVGVLVHVVDVGGHVRARRAVEEGAEALGRAEHLYRTLVDSLPLGVVYQDPSGRIELVNPSAQRLLGRGGDDLHARTSEDPAWRAVDAEGRALPADRHPSRVAARTGAVVRDAVIGVWQPAVRAHRWLRVTAVPLDGGVYTVFDDVTEERRTRARLEESHQLLQRLQSSSVLGMVVATPERVVAANDAFLTMVGRTRADVQAGHLDWQEITPPEYAPRDAGAIAQVLSDGSCQPFEKEYWHSDGHRVPVILGAVLLERDPPRWLTYVIDRTAQRRGEVEREELLAREQAARRALERAHARLELLAEVGDVMAGTLNHRSALQQVARLLVPRLAEACLVNVRTGRAVERLAVALPEGTSFEVEQLLTAGAVSAHGPGATARVLRTGRRVLGSGGSMALDPAERAPFAALGVRTRACLPLTARGRTLGTLTLLWVDREPSESDLDLADDIAARVAVQLDNALVYQEKEAVARALQASLLPPRLPRIEGLTASVLYRPGRDGVDVGGDFYDLLDLPGHGALVVVGDVCGKGPEAAGVTGLIRHTVRALAARESDPAAILTEVNAALLADETVTRFATVCCLLVEPSPDGGAAVTVANAGHPAPLVLRPGRAPQEVPTRGTIVGEFEDFALAPARVALAPGDAVLLYTDGLLGRAPALAAPWPWGAAVAPAAVVEAVAAYVATMAESERFDDVCVLAVAPVGSAAG